MSETQIIVVETPIPLVVEVFEDTVVTTPEDIQEKTVEILAGQRGVTTQWILGALPPTPTDGVLGDVWLVTQGINAGDTYKKLPDGTWSPNGSIKGAAGGINTVNGIYGPDVVLDKTHIGLGNVRNTDQVDLYSAQSIDGFKTFVQSPTVPDNSFNQSAINGLGSALSLKVGTQGAWTIAGLITFSNAPVVPDSSFTIAATAGLQPALDAKVALTGAQTIAGIKTFSDAPVVPDSSFTIAKTTGLQTALDAKQDTIAAGTTAQYRRGDNTWQTLNLVTVDLTTAQTVAGIKTFSVSPIVPTPTTNMQAATKLYVDTSISDLIASAPGLLNTLDELAAALGDDPNFATTVTDSIALKAPLASPAFTGTVTGITKTMVGLGNVDNTADTAKPVSTAQQTALNLKVNNTGAETIAGIKTFSSSPVVPDSSFTIAKTTGLQSALDLKAPLASPTFTGTVAGITKTMVGLGNVDNTADTAKPVSTAQQTALNLKANIAGPTFTGTVTGTFSGDGSALTTLNGSNISSGTVAQARIVPNIVRVVHGATSGTARPTGATYVEWVGSVSPSNATSNDTWWNTA